MNARREKPVRSMINDTAKAVSTTLKTVTVLSNVALLEIKTLELESASELIAFKKDLINDIADDNATVAEKATLEAEILALCI